MFNRRKATRSSYRVGRELLGPIFYQYCYRLQHYLEAARDGSAVALFMARGGFRLQYLHELYRGRNGLDPAIPERPFFVSRFAAARGCLLGDPGFVAPLITREFAGLPVEVMLGALLPGAPLPDGGLPDAASSAGGLIALLERPDRLGDLLREALAEQTALLREYLYGLIGGARRVLLVDSGWTGNTQAMLMRSFPDLDWLGCYFGRWDYRRCHPGHFGSVIGVSLDGTGYHPLQPATALFCYHHLIEGVLEVPIASTSGYLRDPATGQVVPDSQIAGQPLCAGPAPGEQMFQGVVDYFRELPSQQSGVAVDLNARLAFQTLGRLILYPQPGDYGVLLVPRRSADFGKPDQVPVLVEWGDPASLSCLIKRLRGSLWVQGQVARDWGRLAPVLQFALHLRMILGFVRERGVAAGTRYFR